MAPRLDSDPLSDQAPCLRRLLRAASPPEPPAGIHFQPTAVFMLLFQKNEAPHLLAIQKSDREGYPWRNQVALPGGHVDAADADALSAAFREVEEELGIPPEQIEFLGRLGHFQTINRKDIEVFAGLWNGTGPVRHDPMEIARVLEVPMETLARIHRRREYEGRVPDIHELVYPLDDVVIWGVTARILHFFIELLHDGQHHCGSKGICHDTPSARSRPQTRTRSGTLSPSRPLPKQQSRSQPHS